MARRKQGNGRLIERVDHGPFSAEIRMNDMGVFSVEVGALGHSGPLPEVREWARTRLREISDLKWQPVMEVNFDEEDQRVNCLKNSTNMACYMERFWIAWTGDKWIRAPWVVFRRGTSLCSPHNVSELEQDKMTAEELNERRIAHSRDFDEAKSVPEIRWPLVRDSHRDKCYCLEFTEERWQTMIGIMDRIRELRAAVNKLLSTESGWKTLAKVAQSKMLTNG